MSHSQTYLINQYDNYFLFFNQEIRKASPFPPFLIANYLYFVPIFTMVPIGERSLTYWIS
uniref:Uncharacterized protein n=1 Tax=Picea glauca TaxID=3330 RepID=A0A101LV12_PICGL|nr:hypothetical protein ABT39_MTgene2194 [Picea glauca]